MSEFYHTKQGSTVEVKGKYRGHTIIDFDWMEEGACFDAYPSADVTDPSKPMLHWSCRCHDESGSTPLEKEPTDDR